MTSDEMTRAFDEAFATDDPAVVAQEILRDLEPHHPTPSRGIGTRDDLGELPTIPTHPSADPIALLNEAITKLDAAYGELKTEVDEIRRKPPRERRTGAAARMNPDDIRVFYWVLAGSALLPLFTFAASFNFQRAFGAYTPLDEWWWWIIPCILELPLVLLTPMILIFRRRHESTRGPWTLMVVLTAAASAINFAHAADAVPLTSVTAWLGALFIASWPVLTLVTFKFFARLAVKPTVEAPAPAPAARKTTKKGPRK